MRNFLYTLVLLLINPYFLWAAQWEGEYKGEGNLRFGCPQNDYTKNTNIQESQYVLPKDNSLGIFLNIKDGKVSGKIFSILSGSFCPEVSTKFTQVPLDRKGTFRYSFNIQTNPAGSIAITGNLNKKTISLSSAMITNTTIKLKKTAGNTLNTNYKGTSPTDPLSAAFKGLSSKTRKNIQIVLKEKGFYKSTIDGLYGQGTREAILGFFKEKGLSDELKNLDMNRELSLIATHYLSEKKDKKSKNSLSLIVRSGGSNTTSNLSKYKEFCEEIGLKIGTEKFADCVLKAMDKD